MVVYETEIRVINNRFCTFLHTRNMIIIKGRALLFTLAHLILSPGGQKILNKNTKIYPSSVYTMRTSLSLSIPPLVFAAAVDIPYL